jgi:sugar/nucleoside kinase (ribokinase family)
MSLLMSIGPKFVLITDGTGGAYLASKDGIYHCPIKKANVRGTAGAGDSFTSTFGAILCEGKKPEIALQLATINSSSVVEFVDTQSGLLPRKELEKRYETDKANLPVSFWPWQD